MRTLMDLVMCSEQAEGSLRSKLPRPSDGFPGWQSDAATLRAHEAVYRGKGWPGAAEQASGQHLAQKFLVTTFCFAEFVGVLSQ